MIAQQMNNTGLVAAEDTAPERLRILEANCARLGITCVRVSVSGGEPPSAAPEFDRALVDTPCSNTGVLRRRVDLRWRLRPEDLPQFQATQLGLLDQAACRVRSGGVLVYSTCSLEPEENSSVVTRFLATHPDYLLESEKELAPFIDGVDGAYVARLCRKA
jgi:16S rRNA (cytosine967-C5)-methyltransferase